MWLSCDAIYSCDVDLNNQKFIPNKIKNLNVKAFNLMSVPRVNEIKCLLNHDKCWCECRALNLMSVSRVNEIKCLLNHDKCWCECKELVDWSSCKDSYL